MEAVGKEGKPPLEPPKPEACATEAVGKEGKPPLEPPKPEA
jgi:hypothetical protein